MAPSDMHPEHKCHVLCQRQCPPNAPEKPAHPHDMLPMWLQRHQLQRLRLCSRRQLHLQSNLVLPAPTASASPTGWLHWHDMCHPQLSGFDHLQATVSTVEASTSVRTVYHCMVRYKSTNFYTVLLKSIWHGFELQLSFDKVEMQ